jgi:hypothetical protein
MPAWLLVVVIVLAVIAAAGAAAWLIGRSLPVGHVISRSRTVKGQPDEVWDVITDFASEAQWNSAIRSSSKMETGDGRDVWVTRDRRGGKMPLETVERRQNERLVRKIADPKLPFGGVWIIELERDGADSTVVTVTEDGEVYNAFFSLVSRYFMDQSASIEKYLDGLSKRMAGGVSP